MANGSRAPGHCVRSQHTPVPNSTLTTHAVVKRVVQPDVLAERLERYAGSADLGMSTDEILYFLIFFPNRTISMNKTDVVRGRGL